MAEDFLHFLAARAEKRIAEARDAGVFDSIPGEGKPLDFEDDAFVPEELRMAYKILKNSGYAPQEITDRKEINSLLDLLESCEDESEKIRQMHKLDVLLMRLNMHRSRSMHLDENDPYYEKVLRRVTLLKKDKTALR